MADMRRYLVGCEMSGIVRDALAEADPDAEVWSCDVLPTERPARCVIRPVSGRWEVTERLGCTPLGNTFHYQGDVRDLFDPEHPANQARFADLQCNYIAPEEDLWTLGVMHPPCFTAGTPVITARGVLPIEQVGIGDQVLTHKGRWRIVTGRMSREARVITDGQVTATPDHPFWVRRKLPAMYGPSRAKGGGRQLPFGLALADWVPASETAGSYLGIPAKAAPLAVPPLAGIVKTTAFWYMVGRWLGDGWTRIEDTSGHNHFDTIICCARGESGDLAAWLAETGLKWRRSEERTVTRFTLSDTHLCRWLEECFGRYAHGKTLPGWIFGAPEGVRQSLLNGYLDADGSRQATASPSLISNVPTVSRGLAVGIRVLATTLGYTTTLTRNRRAGQSVIEGRTVTQRDSWTVVIRKDDGRFTRFDGTHRWVKQRRSWQDAGVQVVYDIIVDEDHSFTAHGFAVHNCDHLSQAGAVWWKHKDATRGGDGRMQQGAAFFMEMVKAPARYVAVENPVGVMGLVRTQPHVAYREPDQIVEPWMFGDPLAKQTCWWLKGLPLLVPVNPVKPTGRVATGGGSWRTDQRSGRGANNGHEDSEGRKNRKIVRSRTSAAMARAMASQWTAFIKAQEAAA